MAYNNQDQAYILPSYGLSDSQKLGAIQNDRQLEEQRAQRLYEQKKNNQWRNLNLIQDDLAFGKYKTGEQAIDGYAQTELQKIQKEALANHITDEPAQLEFWLQEQLQPLSKWHNMALGTYKKLDQSLQDLNKQYPNIDYSKARDLALNKFQNDFLEIGEGGQLLRKNTDQIKPTDYAALLQQPQVLGLINNDQSDFAKFFYDIPKSPIGDRQYTNKQGHVKEYGWSGFMPQGIGELVTDDDNRPTGVRLRSDVIPSMADANGNPMRMLPEDVFQQLKGNPKAYTAALGKWYNSPERQKAEMAYMKQTNQQLTPDVEDMLFKSYLYNEANRLVAHDLKTEEKQTTPKPPRITINVGNQQLQMTGNWAKSVVAAAANDDNATVNQLIDQMYAGNGERKLMGTYTKVENGQPMLYIRTQLRKPKGEDEEVDEQTVAIPANSPNAEALLLGQYQSIMGSNTKAESLPFRNNPVVPTTRPQKNKTTKYVGVPDGGF